MNTLIKTQVLVLGAGPGGYSAAFRCADLGMITTIVEHYPKLGGTCLNVGCIPSKALLHISKLIKINKNLYKYGIEVNPTLIDIDINKIRSWKNDIITHLSNSLNTLAKARNINIIHGTGKFIDNHTLIITNENNQSEIKFDYAIIATGSRPMSLPSIPLNDQRIWNSTDALLLKFIPKRLLIIGSGAIGLEMATIYHALGSKIDLVEKYDQIMPKLDIDITRIFQKKMNKSINFITNTKIQEVHPKQNGIHVIMQNNENPNIIHTNQYDAVLIAIGRSPNSNQLNLNNIPINITPNGFIPVDNQMRTNKTHIFAIGDIIGHPMLAHKSIYEGHIAADVIAGKKRYFDTKVIPSIIYTDPEIAWVGYTEKEAKIRNIQYETATFPWSALGKAITSDCTEGITKLIFDKKTHRIIGGIILGTNASEMIGEVTLAIEMGCDVEDITLTIHAHPTLYESISLTASIYNKSNTELLNTKFKK